MSAGPARPPWASGKARILKSQDSSRCAAGCQDWMLITWIETRCDAAFNDGGKDAAAIPGRGPVPPAPLPPPAVRRIMSAAEPQAQPASAAHSPYPGVVSPDAPLEGTAGLRVLSAGYLGRRFASTVTFVRDGAAPVSYTHLTLPTNREV